MNSPATKKVKPKKPKVEFVSNEFVYSPSGQQVPFLSVFLGYVCRVAVIYIGVLGLLMFLCNAIKVDMKLSYIMILCAIPILIFSTMGISKTCFFAGLTVNIIIIAMFSYIVQKPIKYIYCCAVYFWNHIIELLISEGFINITNGMSISIKPSEYGFNYSQSEYLNSAIILLTIILAIIFVAFILRKTRLFPLIVSGTIICSFVFTYNIGTSNWGFVLIISAICGIIVLKLYDSSYLGNNNDYQKYKSKIIDKQTYKKNVFKNVALGGYVGITTAILCFIILILPAINIQKKWISIKAIDEKMEVARDFVSAIMLGETPNLTDLGFTGDLTNTANRSTEATPRTFTGKEIMSVEVNYNTPIYLRSWIGRDFENDKWYSVSEAEIEEYHQNFGEDFSPETITYEFYNNIDPSLVELQNYDSYSNNIENGFITMQVNVKNIGINGNLIFLPTLYNPEIGLLKYGEDKLYEKKWDKYYDGIITGSTFMKNAEYSTISFVPSYRHPDFGKNIQTYNYEYSEMLSFIFQSNEYDASVYNVDSTQPNLIKDYIKMDKDEKMKLISNIYQIRKYNQFARDNYSYFPRSEAITKISQEIVNSLHENGESYNYHDTIMSVIEYLSKNMTYTLDPTPQKSTSLNSIESFLIETKEGYCVQFATAAVALLRSMGMPTRYVEGYIASEFSVNNAENKVGKYISTVRDNNAHAWIEVYIDDIGWIQYEATTPYQSNMYEPINSNSSSSNTNTNVRDYDSLYANKNTSDTIDDSAYEQYKKMNAEERIRKIFINTSLSILATIIITVFILFQYFKRKSAKALKKRSDTINAAKSEKFQQTEIEVIAKQLYIYTIQIYSSIGYAPIKGELPKNYASRINENFDLLSSHKFTDIMDYIEKEEFGYGMSKKELYILSEYVNDIWHGIYSTLNIFKRIWLRHIKRMI